MNKKLKKLSVWSFAIAVAIFVLTYNLFHHFTPEGFFTTAWLDEPGKPFITFLFGIWGVMFLFTGVISLVVGHIFFPETEEKTERQEEYARTEKIAV